VSVFEMIFHHKCITR